MSETEKKQSHKAHHAAKSGRSFDKKKAKQLKKQGITKEQKKNPRAFAVQSAVRARKAQRRNLDLGLRREHLPITVHTPTTSNELIPGIDPQSSSLSPLSSDDATTSAPSTIPDSPPFLIVVAGPPKVGKTTLIASLVRHYSKHNVPLSHIRGPITLLTSPYRRITLVECPSTSLHAMIDTAKTADLVLLLVDASFGFEMETFEYLNILKTHGFPKVMGVLTHLDSFKKISQVQAIKKKMKQRFWQEICDGAKLFYLSGLIGNKYAKREILNLARFLSVMTFRPLIWRSSHPYLYADRMEDLTHPGLIQTNPNINRTIALYGYSRGSLWKSDSPLHFLGVGDFLPSSISILQDPLPLVVSSKKKFDKQQHQIKSKKKLNEKERKVFAPMSDIGDVLYDEDSIYITMKEKHIHFTKSDQLLITNKDGEQDLMKNHHQESSSSSLAELTENRMGDTEIGGEQMVRSLQDIKKPVDDLLKESTLQLFKNSLPLKASDFIEIQKQNQIALQQSVGLDDDEDEDISDNDEGNEDLKMKTNTIEFQTDKLSNLRTKEIKDSTGRIRRKILFGPDKEEQEDEQEWRKRERDSVMRDSEAAAMKDSDNDNKNEDDDDEDDDNDDDEDDIDDDDDGNEEKDEDDDDRYEEEDDFGDEMVAQEDDENDDAAHQMEEEDDDEEEDDVELANNNKEDSEEYQGDVLDIDESKKTKGNVYLDDHTVEQKEREYGRKDLHWKENLVDKAKALFKKQASVMELVYGQLGGVDKTRKTLEDKQLNGREKRLIAEEEEKKNDWLQENNDDDDDDDDDFFRVKKGPDTSLDVRDSSKNVLQLFSDPSSAVEDWKEEEKYESLRHRFVTGDWSEDRSAELDEHEQELDSEEELRLKQLKRKARKGRRGQESEKSAKKADEKDEERDEDMNDDEMIEVDDATDEVMKDMTEEEKVAHRSLQKAKLKASFDAEYDRNLRRGRGELDDADEDTKPASAEESDSYYKNLHADAMVQSQINIQAFASVDMQKRIALEGIRPGSYVRVILKDVPCEFVRNFDQKQPLILGGLLSGETNLGFLHIRFKKHRWAKKILKTYDPLLFSVGWRRFQSSPVYCIEDINHRLRYLKYTPEHMHCIAVAYGPLTPQGTGVLAYQYSDPNYASFRIAGTGVITEQEQNTRIVKKLKLCGTPFKIFKNTAYISGMFTSALEVNKFIGASIRTVSGIRGQIKKAVTTEGHDGTLRATFEDKILKSDIVFVRSWSTVQPLLYYYPVTSLLVPNGEWRGMRTLKQLRQDHNLSVPQNTDSAYKEINRTEKKFHPLHIPKSLEKELPFAMRPKVQTARASNRPSYVTARKSPNAPESFIIHDKHAKEMFSLMQQVNTVRNAKDRVRKEAKERQRENYLKRKEMEDAKHAPRSKEVKKRRYIAEEQGKRLVPKRYSAK